jgi:hypothetical protein
MIQYDHLLDLQLMMLILLLIGYVLKKKNFLNATTQNGITDLVIYVILPCNIVNSFLVALDFTILMTGLGVLLISFAIQVFCLYSSRFLYKRFNPNQKSVLEYATICSNAGFMGMPVVEAIAGPTGLLFASIYLIPQRIFMWSAGLSCFTPAKGRDVIKKIVTHPCIIAVAIGLFLMLTQIQLPTYALRTIGTLSNCTTALSMLVIGCILADVKVKGIFSKAVLYFNFIRLVLIPGLVLLSCLLLHIDPLVTTVAVVLSGMPAGTTTAILASKYKGDERFAVKNVFSSTLLSMLTIPILCILIERLVVL